MSKINHDIELYDARLQKPTVIKASVTKSCHVFEVHQFFSHHTGRRPFRSPSIVALYISISDRNLKRAEEEYDVIIRDLFPSVNEDRFSASGCVVVFDYLEYIQTAIVMLYTAIEATANILIPFGYKFEQKNSRKGTVELYDKTAIERWIDLKTKLKEILPETQGIPAANTFKTWNAFTDLEKLRNDLIHVKHIDTLHRANEKNIYEKLTDKSIFDTVRTTKAFLVELITACPYNEELPLVNREEIVPVEVEHFEDFMPKGKNFRRVENS